MLNLLIFLNVTAILTVVSCAIVWHVSGWVEDRYGVGWGTAVFIILLTNAATLVCSIVPYLIGKLT